MKSAIISTQIELRGNMQRVLYEKVRAYIWLYITTNRFHGVPSWGTLIPNGSVQGSLRPLEGSFFFLSLSLRKVGKTFCISVD